MAKAKAEPEAASSAESKPTASHGRRVELVEPVPDRDRRFGLIGLGLLLSLVVGFEPLREAAFGAGSFPAAMARYLACVVCSVLGMLGLGQLLDDAPPPDHASDTADAEE
jgi:hypothetical protein